VKPAEEAAAGSWTWVATRAAFGDRDVIGVECGGRRLALYRVAGGVFVSLDRCPHHGAALSHGCVVEGLIECPVHYALFDIRTGAADGAITGRSLRTHAARLDRDDIYVDLSHFEETA
jgi:3-phenylpropionate/trans-cinnamate dioxygenase ferredoxin component